MNEVTHNRKKLSTRQNSMVCGIKSREGHRFLLEMRASYAYFVHRIQEQQEKRTNSGRRAI